MEGIRKPQHAQVVYSFTTVVSLAAFLKTFLPILCAEGCKGTAEEQQAGAQSSVGGVVCQGRW